MTYFANYLLPAFIHAVTGEFTSEFGAEQYQREVGRVIEQASKKFFGRGGSNLIAQKTKEWVQDTKEYIDTFDNNYFDDATDIPKSFIDNLKRNPSSGTGKALISFHRALIIHYRLHMYIDPEDRKFADDLDGKVFSGRTFKQALRKSVFSFEPDAYYQPARMAAPMHHPDYITAKQAKEALEANSDDAIWLSPHNHSTIRLEGREDELNRLTEFAEHRAPFRVLPVIAPSGAGKTRLISEWMKPYSAKTNPATKWEAGFLVSERNDHARDPEPWRKWEIKKNTLIVIDYTYAFDEVVKTIAERAINRAGGESPTIRVRLIVVDHIMPQALQDDFFWRQFSGGRRATMDSFRASYLEKPLVLKSEGHNSNMLRQIVTASARVGGRSISENDRDVSNALEHLDRMGRQQGDRDSARHPLFAALLGQMLRDPEHRPDFSTWSRRDLVDQYFDSRDRLPWGDAHWRSDEQVTQREVEGLYAGALVAAATLRRGINRHTAEPHLPHQNEAIFQIAQRVTSSTKYHFIEPFLPDILGETFLLKFLEAVGGDSDVFASFLALLSSSGEDSQEQARNFGETIARLARNLANDNPELRDVSESWTRLPGLLRPENFAHNTTLRAYAAYVTADVVDQLARITHNAKNNGNDKGIAESFLPIIYKLIRQVKLEFYCTPPSSEELFYRLNSLFCFYEFCDSEYESVIQGIIIKSSFYFHDTGEDKLNVGLFAAYSGRPRSLQLLVNIMGKK